MLRIATEDLDYAIFALILSFPDLLLGLYFTGPKANHILVQLFGIIFLIVTKNYQILVFLKTGLKNGNLKTWLYIGFRSGKLDETLKFFTQLSLQTSVGF